ncbi:hypothetical protein MYCTH_2125036 [Thermothelomyces thermophilus ATCC 42464]|uniref:Major facilitator superfamily (MFS) profile domain-containing protein n=1 Tax=Thermothelomyces thermophilus (strain ATCC 42464 / BCRC 31852 / DSM 1799) TaxID=573729 RepID=G2Q7K9_THET4|nr:uncharacterized protein MYCTH_2125036 [Thermothelomyces thermophilus ATCC 42464]AEO56067.1 hypothetical protein MYCTH_2125036 [Thermothelomyces thermophilus ATCC 42464]
MVSTIHNTFVHVLFMDSFPTDSKSPSKSLPRRQVLLLCFARMMEPIAFFSIFPFVAQMVQRNGRLPESDVGFYSGLIKSLFSAASAPAGSCAPAAPPTGSPLPATPSSTGCSGANPAFWPPRTLGTLNALALTVSSAVRAVAPGATSALYAMAVRSGLLDGQLIWFGLAPLSALMGVAAGGLPKERKPREADEVGKP